MTGSLDRQLQGAARLLGRPALTLRGERPASVRRVDLGGVPGVTVDHDDVQLTEAAEPRRA